MKFWYSRIVAYDHADPNGTVVFKLRWPGVEFGKPELPNDTNPLGIPMDDSMRTIMAYNVVFELTQYPEQTEIILGVDVPDGAKSGTEVIELE